MSAPNPPSDFKALISTPSASLCSNFINTLLKLPVLIYNFMKWLLDDSGNISTAALTQIWKPGDLEFSACLQTEDGTRLLCDGREVSQATYANLYAAIGATYGVAGAGNFKIPNYKGMAIVGIGSNTDTNGLTGTFSLGVKYGEYKHTLLDSESGIASHSHVVGLRGDLTGGGSAKAYCDHADAGSGGTMASATDAKSADANAAMNIVQPSLGAYVYIRT